MDENLIYAIVILAINIITFAIFSNIVVKRVGEYIAEINKEFTEWKIEVRKEYAIQNYLNSKPNIINDEWKLVNLDE